MSWPQHAPQSQVLQHLCACTRCDLIGCHLMRIHRISRKSHASCWSSMATHGRSPRFFFNAITSWRIKVFSWHKHVMKKPWSPLMVEVLAFSLMRSPIRVRRSELHLRQRISDPCRTESRLFALSRGCQFWKELGTSTSPPKRWADSLSWVRCGPQFLPPPVFSNVDVWQIRWQTTWQIWINY